MSVSVSSAFKDNVDVDVLEQSLIIFVTKNDKEFTVKRMQILFLM